jgi:hypothetical protein
LTFGEDSDFPLTIELEEAATWHFTQDVSYDGRRSLAIEFVENADPLIPCEETTQAALIARHKLVPYALNWREQIQDIVAQLNVDIKPICIFKLLNSGMLQPCAIFIRIGTIPRTRVTPLCSPWHHARKNCLMMNRDLTWIS